MVIKLKVKLINEMSNVKELIPQTTSCTSDTTRKAFSAKSLKPKAFRTSLYQLSPEKDFYGTVFTKSSKLKPAAEKLTIAGKRGP